MLEILKYPDPRLKEISEEITTFDPQLHELLNQMAVTMYHSNGIGLAAPQVGRLVRAFIVDLGAQEGEEQKLYEFINPKFSNGEGSIEFEEGCLSLPGLTEWVKRKRKIVIDYQDRNGAPQKLTAEDLLAVATQHENDHLDGILFIDRVSPLKRRFLRKKIAKGLNL